MPVIEQIRKDLRNEQSCWLAAHRRDVYSQFGEDGVIDKIFEVIGEDSRWCAEFGAWDGKHLSNTHALTADRGWSGVFIEGSVAKFSELEKTYGGNPRAVCVRAIVQPRAGRDSLDDIFARTEIPRAFDLLSIDIDGNDYFVWESLSAYRPRVLVIEFNPVIPNDILFIQDCDISLNQGCSLRALIELGKRKGYELSGTTTTNAIFVVAEEFAKLGIADNSIDAIHLSQCDGKYFDCYDGTLYHVGLHRLNWRRREIAVDELQVLPRWDRGFGDAVAGKGIRAWRRRIRKTTRAPRRALKRLLRGG